MAVLVQYLGVGVDHHAALGAEITRVYPHRVKRRLVDRPQAGIGGHPGVAVVTVIGRLAAMTFRVNAAACILIHVGHGFRQAVDIDADLGGQFGNRIGAHYETLLLIAFGQHPVRAELAVVQRADKIPGAKACIEYLPAGIAGIVLAVFAKRLLLESHIVLRFVAEALSRRVHHNGARVGFLHNAQPRNLLPRGRDSVAPPGLVEPVHPGAQANTLADSVAGVVAGAGAPAVIGGLRQVLLAHLLVVLETAGGQYHRPASLDAQWLAIAHHFHPQYPALLIHYPGHGGVEPQGDVAVQHGSAQPGHAGAAGGEAAVEPVLQAPGYVQQVGTEQSGGDFPPAGLLADQQGRLLLGDADDSGQVHHGVRATQAPPFLAQLIGVEGFGLHGAMPLPGALQVGVVIRIVSQADIARAGAPVQELDHFGAVFQVGVQLVVGDLLGGN